MGSDATTTVTSTFYRLIFFVDGEYSNIDEDIMMVVSFCGVTCFDLRFSAHTEDLAIVYRKLSGKNELEFYISHKQTVSE